MQPLSLQGSEVVFSEWTGGRNLISTSDSYTKSLSEYELGAKLRSLRPNPTEQDYLTAAATHVLPWRKHEVDYVATAIERTEKRLNALNITLPLPANIHLVKTTGWEEGGARGYTRGNTIYLREGSLSPRLIWHEIFHILTRFAPKEKVDRIYRTIGFFSTTPYTFSHARRISNPDAPTESRHAIEVTHLGQQINAGIVLIGAREYTGGTFFGYIQRRLLLLDGSARLLPFPCVTGLRRKLGRNTAYDIHQEEVAAVHFEHLLAATSNLPDPGLVDKLRSVLSTPNTDEETE